ncbi:MAG: uracil-DNA glycosylase family protein [bacterium]
MSRPNPVSVTEDLNERIKGLTFEEKVEWYYNPLDYAFEVHKAYLKSFGNDTKTGFFLGMNPGPWGMAQTGIPFTDPHIARDWMGLPERPIGTPPNEREDRPVDGWSSDRKEASGQKLHGYFRNIFGSLDAFFETNIVMNYCPLVMFSEEATNLTPEDLLKDDRQALFDICDPYLGDLIEFYDPDVFVGIGRFGQRRLMELTERTEEEVAYLPHPSPASPIATRDGGDYWRGLVDDMLEEWDLLPDST